MARCAPILTLCILGFVAGERATREQNKPQFALERAASASSSRAAEASSSSVAAPDIVISQRRFLTEDEREHVAGMLVGASAQSGLWDSKETVKQKLGNAKQILLAKDSNNSNKIVGAIAVKNRLSKGCNMSEIGSFVVDDEYRGQNVNTKLVSKLKEALLDENLNAIYYVVSVTNYPSLSTLLKDFPESSVAGYFKRDSKIYVVSVSPQDNMLQSQVPLNQCKTELKDYFKSSSDPGQLQDTISDTEMEEAIESDQLAMESATYLFMKKIRSKLQL